VKWENPHKKMVFSPRYPTPPGWRVKTRGEKKNIWIVTKVP